MTLAEFPVKVKSALKGILNSYSQVFFSNNILFAVILLLATFVNFKSGISGLAAVLITHFFARIAGLDKKNIEAGYYGFNSLLVGLGLGLFYEPTFSFFVLLFFIVLLTLFLTVAFSGILGKYGLPFLSLPFLFAYWLAVLATRGYRAIDLSATGHGMVADLFSHGNERLFKVYEQFGNGILFSSLIIYLKSLGAIFFEYNILAGTLIAVGILLYSRIAFCLSLIGFYAAYLFYIFIGGNITEMTYSYIGFNFILSSIAIGGFFIVPSKYSYLWVIVLTPLIVILTSASTILMNLYWLPVYSLPFNIIVMLFLYFLKFRTNMSNKLQLVSLQQNSPEKNLYSYLNHAERFGKFTLVPIHLPFNSKWHISQGKNGKITHRDDWKFAWDFNMIDEDKKSYSLPGNLVEEYYCFNKPVTAPADGYVIEIADHIADNRIGEVDIQHNWGNTIIIKHAEFLYSQICHLRRESFKVNVGDYVKRGDIIAHCGSSGRSPEPHVHFQLQSTPYIGSKTIDYPVNHYIVENIDGYELKFNESPQEGEVVSNVEKNDLLGSAFYFIPGKKIHFKVNDSRANLPETSEWEVITDIYNQTCLYDAASNSYAWFYNDGEVFYFNSFSGSKKTLLFYFYLAAYRVPLGFYKGLVVKDNYRIDMMGSKILLPLQDLVAPFFRFLHTEFLMEFDSIEKDITTNYIRLTSVASFKNFGRLMKQTNFEIILENQSVRKLNIQFNRERIEAICTD